MALRARSEGTTFSVVTVHCANPNSTVGWIIRWFANMKRLPQIGPRRVTLPVVNDTCGVLMARAGDPPHRGLNESVYTFGTRCESVLCGDSPQVSPLAERSGAIPGPSVTVRQRWRFGALT